MIPPKIDRLARDLGNHVSHRVVQMMTDQLDLCQNSEQRVCVAYAAAITAVAEFWREMVRYNNTRGRKGGFADLRHCLDWIEQNIRLTIKGL